MQRKKHGYVGNLIENGWMAGNARTFVYSRGKKIRNPSIYFALTIKEALRHTVCTDG